MYNYIWMTKVILHYAHTFEICTFQFHSDLDAEYVVLFVERLMAREVRCRGTD